MKDLKDFQSKPLDLQTFHLQEVLDVYDGVEILAYLQDEKGCTWMRQWIDQERVYDILIHRQLYYMLSRKQIRQVVENRMPVREAMHLSAEMFVCDQMYRVDGRLTSQRPVRETFYKVLESDLPQECLPREGVLLHA